MKKQTFTNIEPTIKLALERIAKADGRSLSSLINKIVTDWVKAQGGK